MKTFLLLCSLGVAASSMKSAEPVELKLWGSNVPGKMVPPSAATQDIIRSQAGKGVLAGIHEPTMTIHRPAKPNGTSVIVAPGGGYAFLSPMHESTRVCEWLNSLGVTAILLKYRTPTCDESSPHDKPVQDALRAIATVRDQSREWRLDPKRVGLLGFGSGGNLLAHAACDRAWQGQRPDFGINVRGGGFVDPKQPGSLAEGFSVPADAPPMFMGCAPDDGLHPAALVVLHSEYMRRGIATRLHLFTKDSDGSGQRNSSTAASDWPQRCAQWMDDMGWLPSMAGVTRLDERMGKLREEVTKLEATLRLHMSDDCPTDFSQKLTEAKMELLKAEQTKDQVTIEKAKSWVAEWERLVKLDELGSKEREDIRDKIEKIGEAIKELHVARTQLLHTLEQSRWP